MEKKLEMGKVSATGSFHMFVGVATSTIILAVGSIILTRLMSPSEYGLYGVALIPSYMAILFRDWGVNSAMTKYIANLRAADKGAETRDIVFTGLIFEVASGLVLSLVLVFLADFIASNIFHRPDSALFISVVAVTIFSGSLLTAAQSSFVGFERMELNSLTMICQSVAKSIAGPALVILGYGVLGAIIGYTMSFLAAGIIGVIALYFILFKPLKRPKMSKGGFSRTLKPLLKYGVPLSIASLISGILAQLYGFMMVIYASDTMIGNYQAAFNFSVLLTFFTTPIGTVLFPAFAKLDPQNEHEVLKAVFASSVKYTAILLVPATMAIMVLSGPMVSTLFGERYTLAPFFLTLYVTGSLFVVLGSNSVGSFLTGLGETRLLLKQSILTLSIGLPLGFLLIPMFGITGMILGLIFSGLPSMIWGLFWAWKHHNAKADFKSSARILAASSIATIITYALLHFVVLAEWIRLATGLVIFLAVYIFTAPMIGAITRSDIDNLRAMLSGLGTISRLLNLPLIIVERVCNLRAQTKSEPSN